MTADRWARFSLAAQLMNVDSELARAESLLKQNDQPHAQNALARALELLDLTVTVQKNRFRRREIARLRELTANIFVGGSEYPTTLQDLRQLLQPFLFLIAKERGV